MIGARQTGWNTRSIQPRLPWSMRPLRPADISNGLVSAMLARENMLEDVNYHKVVPNHFLVEVSEDNFRQNYQPIESRITRQWSDRLQDRLATANSRMGRHEYDFGGPLRIAIRAASGLQANQARILSRIHPGELEAPPPANRVESPAAPPALQEPEQVATPSMIPEPVRLPAAGAPCLEMNASGRRWILNSGITTIGRSQSSHIFLNMPDIQEKRLVSGVHAYILGQAGGYRLFDGAPGGKPSVNGTYVNDRRVPPQGHLLQEGDRILLAAVDPENPRPDTPGVALFLFHIHCS